MLPATGRIPQYLCLALLTWLQPSLWTASLGPPLDLQVLVALSLCLLATVVLVVSVVELVALSPSRRPQEALVVTHTRVQLAALAPLEL
jgi:hypothetical protein